MYDDLVRELRESAEWAENSPDFVVPTIVLHTMRKAADAIEELVRIAEINAHRAMAWAAEAEKAENAHRWIPVTERLPEEEESVFVVRKFLGIKGQVPPSTYTEIAYRINDRWVADSDEYKIARHKHTDPLYWMPLPEPPKEEA